MRSERILPFLPNFLWAAYGAMVRQYYWKITLTEATITKFKMHWFVEWHAGYYNLNPYILFLQSRNTKLKRELTEKCNLTECCLRIWRKQNFAGNHKVTVFIPALDLFPHPRITPFSIFSPVFFNLAIRRQISIIFKSDKQNG
jgi:hypothetical protein